MKSLPVPVAQARQNMADVLETVRQGGRIRLTRHGKPVGWIIGEKERERLSVPPRERAGSNPTVAKRRVRAR
jgi:prevent-host-death family protein